MEKIKQFIDKAIQSEKGKDILIVAIVILTGLVSFELGRLSNENDSGGIKILPATPGEYQDQDINRSADNIKTIQIKNSNSVSVGKNFFASKKGGSKYYSLGCSAGKTIKQENRIYFNTGEEAQTAGYTLSSSCN